MSATLQRVCRECRRPRALAEFEDDELFPVCRSCREDHDEEEEDDE